MKKWRNIILLFIFVLNFVENISQENVNSGLNIGDTCTFNETIKGACSKINKCDYITENAEFRRRIPEEIKKSLCLSRGRQQLVCCPSLFKPQDLQTNKKDESKFEKATCVNIEPQISVATNIVGGEEAEVGEFKFQATIGYKAQGSSDYLYRCGGALIAEDIVITSASCLRLPRLKLAVVKIGATSLNNDSEDFSESEDIEIQTSIPHPQYSSYTRVNDIGLIQLQRPYNEENWSIAPICLSTNDEYVPQNFTITGYRINFGEESTRSNWLLTATTIIHPNNHSKETQIRVEGYKGIESCFGDLGGNITGAGSSGVSYGILMSHWVYPRNRPQSSFNKYPQFNVKYFTGPLFHEINFGIGTLTYLYGVKSYGHNCSSSLPSIYTKVNSYIQWIKEAMESLDKYKDVVLWS